MRGVMNRLKRGCIYYKLEYNSIRSSRQAELHEYISYILVEIKGCRIIRYKE
jgi:hypothetical protein